MFGMFRVVKYYLAMKKVGSESFNSQMAIICPGGKLNNFKFQILLATGDARLFATILNGILEPLKSSNFCLKLVFDISGRIWNFGNVEILVRKD